MKIQCVLCKEIVPIGAFGLRDAGIEVTCSACGEAFFVAAGDEGDAGARGGDRDQDQDQDQAQGVEMVCPKCGEGQPDAAACRVCGLRAVLFDDFTIDDDDESVAALEPMWDALVSNWGDDAAHKQFVDAGSVAGQLAWVARRYRARLRNRPDDTVASEQLERVARMAQATLSVGNTSEMLGAKRTPYKNVALLLILLVLVAGLGGLYFLFKVKSAEEHKPDPLPPDVRYTSPPVRAPSAP